MPDSEEIDDYLPEEGIEEYCRKRGYNPNLILIHHDTYKALLNEFVDMNKRRGIDVY